MGERWKAISSHLLGASLFVACNIHDGESSVRVVWYSEDDGCFCVAGKNESYGKEYFTHWACQLPDLRAQETDRGSH